MPGIEIRPLEKSKVLILCRFEAKVNRAPLFIGSVLGPL